MPWNATAPSETRWQRTASAESLQLDDLESGWV